MHAKKIILASSSPNRARALQQLGLSFSSQAPDIDETPRLGESPCTLVQRLSDEKAARFSIQDPDALWIGSDQIMLLGDRILGKPLNHPTAIEQLTACSGQTVDVLTGLCVLHPSSNTRLQWIDETTLCFRSLTIEEIEHYLHFQKPYQSCGSIQVEGLGISLFDAIESQDPSAIIGIPLIALCRFLRHFGVFP